MHFTNMSGKPTLVVFGLGAPSKFSPSVLGRGVGGLFALEAARTGEFRVLAVARDPAKYASSFPPETGVEVVRGDVTDAGSVAGLLAGGVKACLFAAQAPDNLPATAVDRDGLVLVARECEKVGAKLLVVSSMLVSKHCRFNPIRGVLNTFVKWGMMDAKLEGEEFVRNKVKVRHTIIRPAGLTDGPSCDKTPTFNQGDSNFFGMYSISKVDVAKILLAAVQDPASDGVTFEVMGPKKGAASPMQLAGVFDRMKKDA